MWRWVNYGGYLVSATSLLALVKNLYNLQLVSIVLKIYEFYQSTFHWVGKCVGWLLSYILPFTPPPDLVILWTVMAASLIRFLRKTEPKITNNVERFASLATYVLFAIIWPVVAVISVTGFFVPGRPDPDSFFGWSSEIAKVIVVFLFLFALNSGLSP